VIVFDAAHATVHYPADRRFRIWIRPSLLAAFLILAALAVVGAWIEFGLAGLPAIAAVPQIAPDSFTGPHGFPAWVRYCHFFTFLFVTMLIRSGLSILFDHPRLYFNDDWTPGSGWIRLSACGQTKRPRSSRLANRHRPSPSYESTLTRSPRLPRKTNTWPEYGFCSSTVWVAALRPLKPRRMSVTPAAIQMFVFDGSEINGPVAPE
jgi:hypothetical protein